MEDCMLDDIKRTIRDFVKENYLFGEDSGSLQDETSLLDAGIIDSTGILELVEFLESRFNLKMHDAEIVPENLDSIQTIASFVHRRTEASGNFPAARINH
jgi:acyl carrier protein